MTHTYASAGTEDITPDCPVPLAGSESRSGAFRSVADRLEANALLLMWDGSPVVLVSVDLVFVGEELRTGVLARLGTAVGDDRLFFAASHTHFAPATDDRRPRLGRVDPGYLEQVCDRVAGLVSRLLDQSPRPAVIEYIRGEAHHSVNRRRRAAWQLSRRGPLVGAVVAAPNPAGPRDEAIHLLRISSPNGRPIAVIWSYACHPVSYPRALEVTPEYPGRARQRLRQQLGAPLPVLFVQGFAGDIRPREPARARPRGLRIKRAALGPRFGRFEPSEWESWADSLAACVAETATRPPWLCSTGAVRARRLTRPLSEFVVGADQGRQVAFHAVALGDDLVMVGVAAEVVAEYGPAVRDAFGSAVVIPVGYIDEVYGYLPTKRMLREGGYEVSWFLKPFGLKGPLHPEIEQHTMRAIRALAASFSASPTMGRV